MYLNINVIAISILSIEWLLFLFLFGRLYIDIFLFLFGCNRYFYYSLDVIAISCGSKHVVVVGSEGEVLTWGCGADGRLGLGTEDNQ